MFNLRNFINHLFQVLRLAVHEFFADDGFNLAAGLSFFAIFSIIPLILIVISVLGHMLGQSDQLFEQISSWVLTAIPQVQPDFIIFLRQLVDKKLTSGWIGIGFLFFVASLLFKNIEHLLDKILKSGKRRNFWHSSIFSIVVLIITALLFFVPAQVNLLTGFLQTHGSVEEISQLFKGNFASFIAHGIIFLLLLRFVPNQSMRLRNIAGGAVLFATLTVLARYFFHWYMGLALERYHFIYGSLTILVVLILWIYYLSLLFVFCGEVVSALQKLFPQEAPSE
jgi:membrane protein